MHQVHQMDHPLITHKLTMLRDKNTSSKHFREIVRELSTLMAYEVTKNFPLKAVEIETPICKTTQRVLAEKDVVIVPILRAGLGMVEGFTHIIPNAKIGHIGLYRDPDTLEAVEYYKKLPSDISDREAIITDPMLATGVSAVHTIDILKRDGCKNIKLAVILAAPEGIAAVHEKHPDVPIYCACIDEGLNDHAYIVPGLGDAGDRLFGTK
ncbi:MAG: uracil phosphoribosyltransferase [Eubacterium sp.]|nr:uracil phosphoribosyltransferase [Eubacterium sp.]